ncbi:MAG: DNA recombination protein RmuC [Rhodospirillales bacterium]
MEHIVDHVVQGFRTLQPPIGPDAGAAVAAVAAVVVIGLLLIRGARIRGETAAHLARFAELADRLVRSQAELTGRLEATRLGVDQRLDGLTRRLGDSLVEHGQRTGESLRGLHERLAVIDSAQKTIGELSAQVGGLQDILANKQARGALGEIQLKDLVADLLPPSAYVLQATLGNRNRADCLVKLPDPPGPLVIDAKFPLESYRALRGAATKAAAAQAARAFDADVRRHVRDIQDKYIVPGETADSALMFLPSEAVYAEIHARFPTVVAEAFRRKVWLVSPTTLWATLNTVRAVLKDVRLREQAGLIQAELRAIAEDVTRLDERVGKLQRHFEQAVDDVRQIRISADKVAWRAARIDLARIEAGADTEADPEAAADAAADPESVDERRRTLAR